MIIQKPDILIKILSFLLALNLSNIQESNKILEKLRELNFQPFPEFSKEALYFRFPDIDKWKRSEGPIKIGIQVGHWILEEPPLELNKISKTGAVLGILKEVDINYLIGKEVAKILENKGYKVDLLPAVLPESYYADAFVSLHTNSTDSKVSGFMISTPFVDYSGKAFKLKESIIQEYSKATGFNFIDEFTQNMTHYYSFNWSRYKNTIHPKTPAVILEMGNMKNQKDLLFLILGYQKVAEGIANGIENFIKENY